MNIALIGFMGVGKSTVSRALHEALHMEEIDMDLWIEKKAGKKIADIFAAEGEKAFRDLETEACRVLSEKDGVIISCGGGAVLRPENVEFLKGNGKIVLLTATPETVFERVRHGKDRPILNGNMNVAYIAQLMEKRRAVYEACADLKVATDGKTPAAIARELKNMLGL